MDTSTHIEDYLERLIQFKQAKEIHSSYLEEKERYQLLKELTLSLDFEESLWHQREQEAAYNFFVYDQIKDDYNLNTESSTTYKKLCRHFLEKAINLDPFNTKYLAEYVKSNVQHWKAEKFRKIQYLQLFRPTTTEATAIQVDLGLRQDDIHFDYFTDEVIGAYIDAMVFLKEQVAHESHYTSEEKLKNLASQAGIDDMTMREVKKEVDEMYELISDVNDDHWLSWKKVHKAYLTADKMVDLDPYKPRILEAAIKFYGYTLWRVVLDATKLTKATEGYTEFCLSFYGKKKPKIKDKIYAAQQAMDKAHELKNRYLALPEDVFSNKSDEDRFMEGLNMHNMMGLFKRFSTPLQVNAFVHAQSVMHKVYNNIFLFKQNNFKFALITGAIFYLGSAIACQIIFGSWLWLWSFIMIPGLAAFGVAAIRKVFWKERYISIDLE